MAVSKIANAISAAGQVALFFIGRFKKAEKQSYEENRHKTPSSAADEFERQFNPNGLCGDEQLSGNKASPSKRD